jgi:ABC-2 type transport system ATP-binding protein
MTVRAPSAATVTDTLARLAQVSRSEIVAEEAGRLTLRVYPDKAQADGAFAARVAEATATRWTIEQLHTEEGRLDDVFRSLTRPDTAPEAAA